jgi:hypothetical protein
VKTKKILIIGYVWPEPDSSAAGSRMVQLIDQLRLHNHPIIFASPATPGSHRLGLSSRGITEYSIQLNSSSFDSFILEYQPDLVIFDRFMMEEQFGWRVEKNCPQACRILDTEDLHFLRQARQQALKQKKELSTEDFNGELALREVASILRSDLTLMISSYEIDLLTLHFNVPAQLLLHLPFMLTPAPTQQACEETPSFGQRQHFITIGNFRHAPNWDSVLYLKEKIWPLIRKQLPTTELHIYGAYPPPKATALHNPTQGFLVKGWAKDAQQVMRNARLCLAPLRFGAGLKGKLCEAMQCGTPSITTHIGAEAMSAEFSWPGIIEDTPKAFAEAAVSLYQAQPHWEVCQAQGFEILNALYDSKTLGKRFISRLESLQANLSSERQKNFIGAMLRHHSMKSTQYMSQWIEVKNELKCLAQEKEA